MKTIYYTHVIDSTEKACKIIKEYTNDGSTSYVGQKFKNKAGLVCFLHPCGCFIHWDWPENGMREAFPDCKYICIDDCIGVL